MSSRKISATDSFTQPVPKLTRAARLAQVVPGRRLSTACPNSAMRVSAQSRRPNSSGEFVAQASTGPASTWAML